MLSSLFQDQNDADVAAESQRLQVRLAAEQRRRQEAFLNRQTDGAYSDTQHQKGDGEKQRSDPEQVRLRARVRDRDRETPSVLFSPYLTPSDMR